MAEDAPTAAPAGTARPRDTGVEDLARALAVAGVAAGPLAAAAFDVRAGWLRAVADALDGATDELVPVADSETHLGEVRLRGEVGRTTGQLRLFADVVEDGAWREVVIDRGDPAATPPRPDVRRMLVALGPVAVFAASNFPFAFSVLGGDTASALAAGCPVVAKAHPGHPRLSALVEQVAVAALARAGAPAGTFAVVHGTAAGSALVQDPAIRAVGFTGSLAGGRALFDLAVGRPDPIPFYGELGSVNPVVVTPAAVAERRDDLAAGLVASFTLGAGQFCTNPGLVFVPAGAGMEEAVTTAVGEVGSARMLHDGIAAAWHEGVADQAADPRVVVLSGTLDQAGGRGAPVVLATDAAALADDPGVLVEECFGPSTLLVRYDDLDQVRRALAAVPGSLAVGVHGTPADHDRVAGLVADAVGRAGRVLWNGWPTGVAVNWSMQHGGPWPATTAPLHTSVGATAIRRWVRPVAWQDVPEPLLPPELRDDNPLGLPRRLDGVLETA